MKISLQTEKSEIPRERLTLAPKTGPKEVVGFVERALCGVTVGATGRIVPRGLRERASSGFIDVRLG